MHDDIPVGWTTGARIFNSTSRVTECYWYTKVRGASYIPGVIQVDNDRWYVWPINVSFDATKNGGFALFDILTTNIGYPSRKAAMLVCMMTYS